MKRLTLSIIVILVFLGCEIFSRPQYSILQTYGTKCSACHVNVQGGGARTVPGWLSRKDISLIDPNWIGLKKFFENLLARNSYFDDKLVFGFDARWQTARWPSGIASSKRDYMIMQLNPYLIIQPTNWLFFEGTYNLAYEIEKDKRYPAQQPYSFSIYLKPFENLPSLRLGYFLPPMGQKWDDHTMFVRYAVAYRGKHPVVPHDYAEWGAQIDYENISWLSLSAGVFSGKNLSTLKIPKIVNGKDTSVQLVKDNSLGFAARGMVSPPEIIKGLTSYCGGTFYLNDDYYVSSVFLGLGLPDRFSLIGEYARTQKKDSRLSLSFSTELTYQVTESLLPFIRAERSILKDKNQNKPVYATNLVFGSHIILLPSLDLLIEYRILDREQLEGYFSQWAIQIHLYY
ncbi:MAG: hypothetical protein N2560_05700 [Ignavibacteria bacterium]|nr:hypothetical protein [Ignavibacteria bacterium]